MGILKPSSSFIHSATCGEPGATVKFFVFAKSKHQCTYWCRGPYPGPASRQLGRQLKKKMDSSGTIVELAENNTQVVGRTGAPDTGGVAPTGYVVAGGRGACVGIPRVIFARAGISVPVAKGGGPVVVVVVIEEAEAEPLEVEPAEAEEEAGGAAPGMEADVEVDDAA